MAELGASLGEEVTFEKTQSEKKMVSPGQGMPVGECGELCGGAVHGQARPYSASKATVKGLGCV
jgi:hypothetical protein